ncbi:MAG TPA: ABC transporter substrate-binding protein [Cellvibrionaceae bacterium]|nr:ABC transporter substrate-binding protein [Cellvibrionaceae bacterium]
MKISIFGLVQMWSLAASLAAEEPIKQHVTFAFLKDGAPVSFVDTRLAGFCGSLHEHLSDIEKGYFFEETPHSVGDRFRNLAKHLEGKPGIQCGPDTKTRERKDALNGPGGTYIGEFSIPFIRTSTKLLIHKAAIDRVHSLDDEDLRIGVLGTLGGHQPDGRCSLAAGTKSDLVSTSLISQTFHNAKIYECPNRGAALSDLSDGKIDAYASDEIILYNMYNSWSARDNFVIYPPVYQDGFSHEQYVVTLFNLQNSPLIKRVNDWIKSPKGKAKAEELQPRLNSLEKAMQWLMHGYNAQLALTVLIATFIATLAGSIGYLRIRLNRKTAEKVSHQQSTLLNISLDEITHTAHISSNTETPTDITRFNSGHPQGNPEAKSNDSLAVPPERVNDPLPMMINPFNPSKEDINIFVLQVILKLKQQTIRDILDVKGGDRVNARMKLFRKMYRLSGKDDDMLKRCMLRDFREAIKTSLAELERLTTLDDKDTPITNSEPNPKTNKEKIAEYRNEAFPEEGALASAEPTTDTPETKVETEAEIETKAETEAEVEPTPPDAVT